MNSTQWGPYSFLFGPAVVLFGILFFVVVLKWSSKRGGSLISKPTRPGRMDDYGMLVAVSAPPTVIEAEILKRTLVDAGIRATVALTNEGPRVMVWPENEDEAVQILRSRRAR